VVSHLPPGTSNWNKIEHRLFSVSYRVIVELISATTTKTGLTVRCELGARCRVGPIGCLPGATRDSKNLWSCSLPARGAGFLCAGEHALVRAAPP
jgi:hypothetical protein